MRTQQEILVACLVFSLPKVYTTFVSSHHSTRILRKQHAYQQLISNRVLLKMFNRHHTLYMYAKYTSFPIIFGSAGSPVASMIGKHHSVPSPISTTGVRVVLFTTVQISRSISAHRKQLKMSHSHFLSHSFNHFVHIEKTHRSMIHLASDSTCQLPQDALQERKQKSNQIIR
jgi:hypothetical protein